MATKIPLREILDKVRSLYGEERLYFRPASNSWVLDGKGVSAQEIANDAAFEFELTPARVMLVLDRMAKEAKVESDRKVRQWVYDLELNEPDDSELRRWMTLMEAAHNDLAEHEANVHALKQWIWQVKRSIVGEPVVWQVMPIFWSTEGGTGKSYNIERLIEPLRTYSKNMAVSDLSEKFGDKQLSQTYIVFFDEFHGVDKIGVSLFKALLTGKPFDRRGMYSDAAVYAENRLSCIASTNLNPPHGYEDETGVRRVWSIRASSARMAVTSPRRHALDAIDMAKVWAAVSVNARAPELDIEAGLLTYMTDRRERLLRTRTALESFCTDNLMKAEGSVINMPDLKKICRQYCRDGNMRYPKGRHEVWAEDLRKLGFSVVNHSGYWLIQDTAFRPPEADEDEKRLHLVK